MSDKWGYHRGPWSASQRWRWRRSLFRSAKDRVTWDGETVESRRAGALEYLRRALVIPRPVSIKTKDVNTMIVKEFNRGYITKPQAETLLDTAMPSMTSDAVERLLTRST